MRVSRYAAAAAGIVLAAAFVAARIALAWQHETPYYFPDEYIYAELSRSLAENGRPHIRGEPSNFPALLYPIVTSPAWLLGGVETALRATQLLNVILFLLASVPAYLLSRLLRLRRLVAAGVAALAVLVPDSFWAGLLVAESLAYPLAVGAVLAGTHALAESTWRRQALFLLLVAAATFARVQYAVLLPAFVLATLGVAARERSVRALREQAPAFVFCALPLVYLALRGASGAGFYSEAIRFQPDTAWSEIPSLLGDDWLVLMLACGWVIVPGALLGLWYAVARPRTRIELAFGTFATALALGLSATAVFVGVTIKERYLFAMLPLIAVLFALYCARGVPARLVYLALAAAQLALASRVTLGAYGLPGTIDHSPLLVATGTAVRHLGSANASLAISVAAAVLAAGGVVLATSRRGRHLALLLPVACAACVIATIGAVAYDSRDSTTVREAVLGGEPTWVDDAEVDDVTFLVGGGADRLNVLVHLFWNRTITHVGLMPRGRRVDAFAHRPVTVGGDGTMRMDGALLRRPVLADESETTYLFRDAGAAGRVARAALWVPQGSARLALAFHGRSGTGWLAPRGEIQVFAQEARAATVAFRLTAHGGPATIELAGSRLQLVESSSIPIRLRVCLASLVKVTYSLGGVGAHEALRLVPGKGVRASQPRLRELGQRCVSGTAPRLVR